MSLHNPHPTPAIPSTPEPSPHPTIPNTGRTTQGPSLTLRRSSRTAAPSYHIALDGRVCVKDPLAVLVQTAVEHAARDNATGEGSSQVQEEPKPKRSLGHGARGVGWYVQSTPQEP